jgi:hypothetical protein
MAIASSIAETSPLLDELASPEGVGALFFGSLAWTGLLQQNKRDGVVKRDQLMVFRNCLLGLSSATPLFRPL